MHPTTLDGAVSNVKAQVVRLSDFESFRRKRLGLWRVGPHYLEDCSIGDGVGHRVKVTRLPRTRYRGNLQPLERARSRRAATEQTPYSSSPRRQGPDRSGTRNRGPVRGQTKRAIAPNVAAHSRNRPRTSSSDRACDAPWRPRLCEGGAPQVQAPPARPLASSSSRRRARSFRRRFHSRLRAAPRGRPVLRPARALERRPRWFRPRHGHGPRSRRCRKIDEGGFDVCDGKRSCPRAPTRLGHSYPPPQLHLPPSPPSR